MFYSLIGGGCKFQRPFSGSLGADQPTSDSRFQYWLRTFEVVLEKRTCFRVDNVADGWVASYRSGLHQLNEAGLNISTALKPFEVDKEKERFPLNPGINCSICGTRWASERPDRNINTGVREQPAGDHSGQK